MVPASGTYLTQTNVGAPSVRRSTTQHRKASTMAKGKNKMVRIQNRTSYYMIGKNDLNELMGTYLGAGTDAGKEYFRELQAQGKIVYVGPVVGTKSEKKG